jgi:hypothetical protein
MNPLQLEEMMMSSFSSSSILYTMSSISEKINIYDWTVSSEAVLIDWKTNRRACASHESRGPMHVVAAISVEDSRFREPGLVLYECIPSFQDHTSKLVRNRDTRNNYYYRVAFLKAIKWSFFYHGRQQSFYQYLFLEQSAHTCFFQCSRPS